MKRVFISTPTFNINGAVCLKLADASELKTNARRISRTATLDGGALIVDGGFSDADRTFAVNYQDLSEADELALWEIFKDYPLVTMSTDEGCFSVAIETMRAKNGSGSLNIFFKERMSQ
jgi:hypothetical protein